MLKDNRRPLLPQEFWTGTQIYLERRQLKISRETCPSEKPALIVFLVEDVQNILKHLSSGWTFFPLILKSCCSLVDYCCVGNLHASVSLKGITEFKMADRNFYRYMHVLCPESENAIVTVAIHRYPHSADSWWLSRDLSFSIKYLATVISCCAGNLRIVGILWSILDNN